MSTLNHQTACKHIYELWMRERERKRERELLFLHSSYYLFSLPTSSVCVILSLCQFSINLSLNFIICCESVNSRWLWIACVCVWQCELQFKYPFNFITDSCKICIWFVHSDAVFFPLLFCLCDRMPQLLFYEFKLMPFITSHFNAHLNLQCRDDVIVFND